MSDQVSNNSYGLSADMDNRELPADVFARFEALFTAPVEWHPPDDKEHAKYLALARHLGRSVRAIGRHGSDNCLVLSGDWSGFPDPAEYLFLADPDVTSFYLTAKKPNPTGFEAVGFFEDWPAATWGAEPASLFDAGNNQSI